MDNSQKICSNSIREKQLKPHFDIYFPPIRLGKRKPIILATHSVGKTMGKQQFNM